MEWQTAATRDRLDAVTGKEPADANGVPLAYYGDYHASDRTESERRIAGWGEFILDISLILLTSLFANTSSITLGLLYLDSFGVDALALRDWVLADPWACGGFVLSAMAFSTAVYFAVCKTVKDRYYKRQRATPEEWKCQPNAWLTPAREREEWILGCTNAALGTAYALGMALGNLKYGWTKLYYNVDDYGLVWYVLSVPVLFFWISTWAYLTHRAMHHPFLYRNLHKWHHRFQPCSPASGVAFHPVEYMIFVVGGQAAFWVVPFHVTVALIVGAYTMYELILDHSGIMMTSPFFWQPSTKFHDDHHRYFHCNFGQHLLIHDQFFGTVRKVGRRYSEAVFGGHGAPIPPVAPQDKPVVTSPRGMRRG
eukprot:TRINITY_DN51907_c0_g1_i1.p2 TRINITY_DN51907_c0_g1~~TRINITY_DN51907_c0_g1_i1.p2  ORF type:complete len:392 (+),score=142.17 TRINITY_DN51907_c0_g1_i1:77-1177(+)